MATMVTKPFINTPLPTVVHPIDFQTSLQFPLPPNEEVDGAVTMPLGSFPQINFHSSDLSKFDDEWNLSSELNIGECAESVNTSNKTEGGSISLNCSNNNKFRPGYAKTTVANGLQYIPEDRDSTHLPRIRGLSPVQSNNFGYFSSTKIPKTPNDDSPLNMPVCGKDFNKSLYPEIANAKIGATEFMSALGMRPFMCPFGYVEHSSGPELSLSFVLSLSCLISTNFSWRSKTTQNCNEYLFQILKKHELTLRLRLPHQGFYTLEVYAQRRSTSELPRNVFNYIIHAQEPGWESILPFPKAHKDWYVAGFVLKQPMDGLLPSNSHSKFVVRVLRALSVYIMNGGVAVDLQEHEGSWWIGLIKTGVAGSEIGLYAVFTTEPHVSVPLLSFRVVPSVDGKMMTEMSAFEKEIVAIEKNRLEQFLNTNREWLKNILEEEKKHSNNIVSAHKARLLKLSQKQSTKMGHTKHRHRLKPMQRKIHIPELLRHEQKVLEKLRKNSKQRLEDIRKVESETIASIEAGGKKAIEDIRKSFDSLLLGLNLPQEKVSEQHEKQKRLVAELEAAQTQLFSKNTWVEEGLNEISKIHEKLLTVIANLQKTTLESLGSVVQKPKHQNEVPQALTEGEILDQLENMEKEQLTQIIDDAKAYVDGTGEMKHDSIKEIYSLQVKEMQLQDAWIKSHEMGIFEMKQISSPTSEIAIFLQSETEEAMDVGKKRLEMLRAEVAQQSQYLQDIYKEKLSQFEKSEQEKLKEYETKLETALATFCGDNKNLLQKLDYKPQEIVHRLEEHLVDLIEEISSRDLSTFLAIRDAIANNVFAELEQEQTDMLQNVKSVITVDKSGKQIVDTDIMQDLDPIYGESWKHANRVLQTDSEMHSDEPAKRLTSRSESVVARIQKTRKLPEPQELFDASDTISEEESEDEEEKSLLIGETVTDARRCSFLMTGKNKHCKDAVLKLIEESTEQLKRVSGRISPANIQKQLVELKDRQRQLTKAVLAIEDMLTGETKEILRYIVKEVYENFQAKMMTLKKQEEENLLQVRKVKRHSMFEMKEWLKKRFTMMAAHDAKATAKLKNEIVLMIDEMEKLGKQRILCIKEAFEKNEANIMQYYKNLNKITENYKENAKSKVPMEHFDSSAVLEHTKNIYNETMIQLESKVDTCYRSVKEEAISEFQSIEMQEQIKTNDSKARVLEQFWGNVQAGEKEIVNELQGYCSSKEREEAEIAHDCKKGEEDTMDLIRIDFIKKCSDMDRIESRNRAEFNKVESNRLDEIGSLLKDNPWLWSEVKREEEDRLLEKRLNDEERLFELETKQEEALASLRASREMRYSQIENKLREKHRRLKKEFQMKDADYVSEFLTGKARNIEDKVLLEIENIHKEMVKQIKTNDHRTFREMEKEIQNTFESISGQHQKMYTLAKEMQDGVYEPFRTLEEQIRTANRVELLEEDVGNISKEIQNNVYQVLEAREQSQLRGWLETVSTNGLNDVLKKEVNRVEMILKSLERIDELRNDAMSLDIRKMFKVLRNMKSPNHTVHLVLKGILLTLGDHEGFTGVWKNCIRRITPIGTSKLKSRIKKFVLKELDPRIARRALDILLEVPFEKIEEISPELMIYCTWAWAVCEERLEMALRNSHRTPEPANLDEQIQIFKRKYNSDGPMAGPRILFFETDETLDRHTDQMLEMRKTKLFTSKVRPWNEDDKRYHLDF